jgi:hypothetical protein
MRIDASVIAMLALALGMPANARADQVPGRNNNCAATWDTGTATARAGARPDKPYIVVCEDGDLSCDADGAPNGACDITMNACVGQITPTCPSPPTLRRPLKFTGFASKRLSGFVPPQSSSSCGTPGTLHLPWIRQPTNPKKPLKRILPSKKVALRMRSKGFLNTLTVQCVPPTCAGPCPCGPDTLGSPRQLTLVVPPTGSDLDLGWDGGAHNLQIVSGATLRYCLSGCDGTDDTLCNGFGSTGDGTLNGSMFGAPLPVAGANLPLCVVNRYQTSVATITFDVKTGQMEAPLGLFSDVYLTNQPTAICPQCIPTTRPEIGFRGTCSATARTPGVACTIEGLESVRQENGETQYSLSSACLPSQDKLATTLDLSVTLTTGDAPPLLGPLPCDDLTGPQLHSDSCDAGSCVEGICTGSACVSGSGTSCIDAKGGISQACCSDDTTRPCFTSRSTGSITRTGTPGTNGQTAVLAGTFLHPAPRRDTARILTLLPGPGALLLPVQVMVLGG